jgi:LysM repeat protein
MEIRMRIHTVMEGESLSDIARLYSVDKETLIKNNGLGNRAPRVGEELLVLIPTRTYRVQKNDSLDRIALRFGIKRAELLAANPEAARGVREGELLVLRYGERSYGMAATLGTLYAGYGKERLLSLMPPLTYVALGAGVYDGKELRRLFDTREAMDIISTFGKIPLLRVYCSPPSHLSDSELDDLTVSLINAAKGEGYKGIVLGGVERLGENAEKTVSLMREKFLGKDLILITELSESTSPRLPIHSDGALIPCPIAPFGENVGSGECRQLEGLNEIADTAKCFIELPSFAREERGSKEAFLPIDSACESIRTSRNTVTVSTCGLVNSWDLGEKKYDMPSLRGVKEILESAQELGFMGIAFDIMRCPISYIMMFNTYFKAL